LLYTDGLRYHGAVIPQARRPSAGERRTMSLTGCGRWAGLLLMAGGELGRLQRTTAMTTRLLPVSLLGLLLAGLARADVVSGPKEGQKVATLKVYAVTGEPKDKEVDYAGLRKDRPTVYVFVSAKDFSRPMFRFLKKLDEDLGDDGLVVAVWLTDDA